MNTYTLAQSIVMRVALQTPEKNFLNVSLLDFEERVEFLSKGLIDVEIIHSSNLANDNDMPNAVSSGLVESGIVSLNRYVKEVPSVDIFFQPFLLNNDEKYFKAISGKSEIRLSIEKEIKKIGSSVLFWLPYGSVVFVSNKTPILQPSDLENQKVRIFSKTLANLTLLSRGEPKIIPNSEQLFSYKIGKTDLGMTHLSSVRDLKLWEIMDSLTLSDHARLEFVLITNDMWWNRLSFKNKEIIRKAALETEIYSRLLLKENEKAIINELKEKGMKVYFLEENDLELWQKISSPLYSKFRKNDDLSKRLFDLAKYF